MASFVSHEARLRRVARAQKYFLRKVRWPSQGEVGSYALIDITSGRPDPTRRGLTLHEVAQRLGVHPPE